MRSARNTILLAVVLLIGMTTPVLSQNWLSGYDYRKEISADASLAATLATLPDFPVLINITDADLAATIYNGHVVSTTGADITFTKPDGVTLLDFQIEKYDMITGELIAHVKISNFSSYSTPSIYIYYGNSTMTTSASTTGTWDSNFMGIWHLHDNEDDATSNGFAGTNNGTTNASPGAAGDGQKFVGDTLDYHLAYGVQNALQITGDLTLEVWADYDSLTNGKAANYLVGTTGKGNSKASNTSYLFHIDGKKKLNLIWESGNGGTQSTMLSTAAANVNANEWHHYVSVRDDAVKKVTFYVDGVKLGNSVSYTNAATDGAGTDFQIGAAADSKNSDFTGRMDEIRISNSVRSSSWIAATYLSISSSSSLLNVGSEQNDTTCYSSANGLWSDASIWSPAPGYTIASGTAVQIDHIITMDGDIIVYGILIIDSAGTLNGSGYNIIINAGGSLINDGILILDNLTNEGSFINNNDVTVVYSAGQSGTITNIGSLTNNGTLTCDTLDNTNGTIIYNNIATINGKFNNKYGSVLDNNQMTVSVDMHNNNGSFVNNNILTVGDDLNNQHGSITNNGLLTVNDYFNNTNGFMDGTYGDYDIDGQLNNTNGNIDGTIYLDVCGSNGMTLNLVGKGTINWSTVTICGSILPIELKVFNVEQHGTDILVQWTTSTEIGNAYFIIERSIDGHHFEQIGMVIGAGDSYTEIEYNFADTHPTEGICYYRLTQVDINGNERTFKMQAAYYQPENMFSVFPNPSDGKMIFLDLGQALNNTPENIVISLTAVNGDILADHIEYVNNGNLLSLTQTQDDLAPGMYFIVVRSDYSVHREKLIIY